MIRPDYYELLDVSPNADATELKQAYYRQAKIYHPDRNVGNEAAEERFKLIAEAYRILGDETERRLYDEARERDIRYAGAPELASMQRTVRFSARSGRTREQRREDRKPRSPRRFTILPARKKMPPWVAWLIGLFWVSALFPFILRTGNMTPVRMKTFEEKKEKPDPPHEQVRERLQQMLARLSASAEAGDERAQLQLGLLLYSGSTGVPVDREAARHWWMKAAEQGNATATYYLEKCDFNPPPPPEPKEEKQELEKVQSNEARSTN